MNRMVVAKRVVILGFVTRFIWIDRGEQHIQETFKKSTLALVGNARGTAIYFLPFAAGKPKPLPPGAVAEKKFLKKWSGFFPVEAFSLKIKNDTLFLRGTIAEIEYTSDKWSGYEERYLHTYTNPQKLYNDKPKTPRVWGILNEKGKPLANARGLVL